MVSSGISVGDCAKKMAWVRKKNISTITINHIAWIWKGMYGAGKDEGTSRRIGRACGRKQLKQ